MCPHSPKDEGGTNLLQPPWLSDWSKLFIGNLEEYAVFATDLAGTILTWHSGVEQVLGYTREAFIGQQACLIFTDSDRRAGAPEQELSTALEFGSATDERWHVRADGNRFWGSGVVIALPDASGQTVGLAKIVRDRTARWLKEETQGLHALRLESHVAARALQVQTLAADLTLAEQRERQRISQLLHDELQQQLYALQMMLHGAQVQAKRDGLDHLQRMLAEAYDLTKMSMATTRTLLSELSPAALCRGKLDEALAWLAKHMSGRYNLTIILEGTEACPELPEALCVLLFQCVQELLFNVVKHAQAGHASITLQAAADSLRLEVRDDGQGFPSRRLDSGEPPNHGFGLRSVQRRLEVFGGAMRIAALPEKGTRVTIEVPLTYA